MNFRHFVLENLISDLSYSPKRGLLYLGLAVAALCYWVFAPSNEKLAVMSLVFGTGAVALLLKGVFFLRKTSAGLNVTRQDSIFAPELVPANASSAPEQFPPIWILAAQIIQDFGTGPLVLGPLMRMTTIEPLQEPSVGTFWAGAAMFLVGWLVHRLTSPKLSQL